MLIIKACLYCQQEFESDCWRKRKYCSVGCAANANNNRKRGSWSEEELEQLQKWIGKKPLNLIVEDWNKIAKRKGWQQRSEDSLKVKATRVAAKQRGSVKPVRDNWESLHLSRLLGVSADKVRNWRRRGIIEYTKLARNQTAISRKQLKAFAIAHPEELGGIDPKKLRRVLKDGKLVKAILTVTDNAPRIGRKITVIRLDTGDVYPSARQAAAAIAPMIGRSIQATKKNILCTSKSDCPMSNGMDFYQLDYPIFWVSIDIRDDFNQLAGLLLYRIYQDLKDVTGYQKKSCLIVAARIAVEITRKVFHIRAWNNGNLKDHFVGDKKKETVELSLAEFYREIFFKKLIHIFKTNQSLVLQKITSILRRRLFTKFLAISQGNQITAEEYFFDFVSYFFEGQRARYDKGFLPIGHQPSNKLEHADVWTNIYNCLNSIIKVGKKENDTEKQVFLINIIFFHFCRTRKIGCFFNSSPTYKETPFQENLKRHQKTERTYQTAPFDDAVSSSSSNELDTILEKVKKLYDEETFEQLSMFVALKLEDASDNEIADCLELSVSDIPKLLYKLQQAA